LLYLKAGTEQMQQHSSLMVVQGGFFDMLLLKRVWT